MANTVTNFVDSTRNQSFTYDNLHRLIKAEGIYGSFDYVYDLVGNRTERVGTQGNTTVTEMLTYLEGNRLTNIMRSQNGEAVDQDFTLDAAGNPTHDERMNGQSIDMRYDAKNRLINVNVLPNTP